MIEKCDERPMNCCAIFGVRGFPSDDGVSYLVGWGHHQRRKTKKEIKQEVRERIKELEQEAIKKGKSILMASLNSEQQHSAEVLIELGYMPTGWAKRPAPSAYRTRVCVFIKNLNGEDEKLNAKHWEWELV